MTSSQLSKEQIEILKQIHERGLHVNIYFQAPTATWSDTDEFIGQDNWSVVESMFDSSFASYNLHGEVFSATVYGSPYIHREYDHDADEDGANYNYILTGEGKQVAGITN